MVITLLVQMNLAIIFSRVMGYCWLRCSSCSSRGFVSCMITRNLNSNLIVLIPKVDEVISTEQYRPIVLGIHFQDNYPKSWLLIYLRLGLGLFHLISLALSKVVKFRFALL